MEELVTCEGSFRALSESPDSGCSCPSETLFNDGIDDPGQFIVSDRKGSIVMFGDVSTAEMLPENVVWLKDILCFSKYSKTCLQGTLQLEYTLYTVKPVFKGHSDERTPSIQ